MSAWTVVLRTLGLCLCSVLLIAGCGGSTVPRGISPPSITTHHSPASLEAASFPPSVGLTLYAGSAIWSPTPTSVAYQWQDCNSSGQSCSNISGATGTSYTVQASDSGYTLVVVVTATFANGHTASMSSPPTGVVAAATGCFNSPGSCGYPTYSSVGVADCSALTTFTNPDQLPADSYYYPGSGTQIDITANDTTISGFNFETDGWNLYLDDVSGTVIENDCFAVNGDNATSPSPVQGAGAGDSDTTVESSTFQAPGCSISTAATTLCTSSEVNETLVQAVGNSSIISSNVLTGAVEAINGPGTDSSIEDNYIVTDGYQSGGHTEDVYTDQTAGLTIHGNTLLNPFEQTANVFADTLTASCQNQLTITSNLMAGAGYIFYECASGTGAGTASLTFTGNDVARCDGGSSSSTDGGDYCGATDPAGGTYKASIGYGQDTHGYWPNGGFFGFNSSTYCSTIAAWSGNTWDDTGATIPEPTSGNGCT